MAKDGVVSVTWSELTQRTEKNRGVSAKTINESFNAVNKEMSSVFVEHKDKMKQGDRIVVKTPITAIVMAKIPEHKITDEKGQDYNVPEGFGFQACVPNELCELCNPGFEVKKISK
jgi:hypothetical protein